MSSPITSSSNTRAWIRPDGTPVRILIVDDELIHLEYIERFLARDGLSVRTAETGSDAIRIADVFGSDLLLADWMLRCEIHGIENLAGAIDETLESQRPVRRRRIRNLRVHMPDSGSRR